MDSNLKPKISIIMCTYNRANFISDAIKSVQAQTFADWELLILDDYSNDNTKEIVSPFLSDSRIKYIENEFNLGITRNRNKGIGLAKGKYIAVLDSDDYWINTEKLEKQVKFLDENAEYSLIGTNMRIVDKSGKWIREIRYQNTDEKIRDKILIKNQFCHSSVLFRKLNLKYDENLQIWEDYDLWLRIGLESKFANLPIFGVAYRKHGNQSDKDSRRNSIKLIWQIIGKYRKQYPNYLLDYLVNWIRFIRG